MASDVEKCRLLSARVALTAMMHGHEKSDLVIVGVLARAPIRPNSAWKALGVIGPSRSDIKTCEEVTIGCRLFKGVCGSLKFRNNAAPVNEQVIASQMRHARRDVHLETPHVGEVCSPAAGR